MAAANGTLANRQNLLIERNVASLRQALRLLDRVDDRIYRTSPPGFAPHRVGGHLRHILEFYECFLDGLAASHIDYDARRRDETIETCRAMAAAKIRRLIERLETDHALRADCIVWVRMEAAPEASPRDCYLTSSPARELQVLSSHTTHHFALIGMTLAAHGVAVEKDFGMAPSTLQHQQRRRVEAA